MMSQSEDKFNEQWRKAFEKASETPPPSVWDALEKHLNEKEKERTIPLIPWWQKPVAWYAAASVSALLVIGALILRYTRPNPVADPVAVVADRPASSAKQPGQEALTESEPAAVSSAATPEASPAARNTPDFAGNETISRPEQHLASGKAPARTRKTPPVSNSGTSVYAYTTAAKTAKTPDLQHTPSGNTDPVATPGINQPRPAAKPVSDRLLAVEALPDRMYREKEIYMQRRYVFYNPDAHGSSEIPDKPVGRKEEYWAGAGFMPASFNPNMQFNPGQIYQMNNAMSPTTANFSKSDQQQAMNQSKAGLSYALATQGGVRLSRHWSLETGVSYLQGNSSYRSNGFFLDITNKRSADVLANALLSGSARYSDKASDPLMLDSESAAGVPVYIAMDKDVSNTYKYLQVPAYVGYTFYPDKKLNYTILGGGVADFFLKNQLETASGYTLTTRQENKVYNSVNWSAATGLRISYRLSSQWNTTLTGSYQQSLMTTFRDNDFLKARPQVYGVSWGVRYTF